MGLTSDLDDVSVFVECAMSTVRVGLQIAFVLLHVPQRMRTGARLSELEHDRWRVVNPDAVLFALALLFGSGEGWAFAVTMVNSPSFFAAYLRRICSMTVSLDGS
jgi:hypothetical protein